MKKYCIAILLLATGCATVLKREGEPIAVASKPSGADAVIECRDGVRASGVTPTKITIPRIADGCVLSISKQGYATKTVPMERGLNAPYWTNFALLPGITLAIFIGGGSDKEDRNSTIVAGAVGLSGLLGFVVDRADGRGYRHFPDEIDETLTPSSTVSRITPP